MEQLKYYARITGDALRRWLLITGSGLLLCAGSLFIALNRLGNNPGADWGTAARQEPWSSALLLGSLALPAVYVLLANRITLGFALYALLDNKLLPLIGDKVSSLVSAFIAQQGGLGRLLGSASTLRDRLIAMAGEDSRLDRIQRKAVRHGLARIRLDDLDFRQPDINLPGVISGRVVTALQAAAEPGYQPFWIVASGHAALLILALLFGHS